MKRAVVTPFCDLHYAKDPQALEPATAVDVPLRFGSSATVLDLCEPCLDMLTDDLQAWLAMGTASKVGSRTGQDRRPNSYYEGLRVWAEGEGIKIPVINGKTVYDPKLKARYDKHMAGAASKSPAPQLGVAP